MKIILYVGLPKTATTFYQTYLFPYLDKNKFIYNPYSLMNKLNYFLKLKENKDINTHNLHEFQRELKELSEKNPSKTLLIVNEHLGYSGFNPKPKWGSELTKLLFPNAKIIISFRYQTDWILSSYRHYMDIGGTKNISSFLNFKDNTFLSNCGEEKYDKFGNMIRSFDIKKLDWTFYLKSFYLLYDKKNINVMFFENFVDDKYGYSKELLKIIGIENTSLNINYDLIKNRGRSAFTCLLTEKKSKLLIFLNIKARSIPLFNEKLKNIRMNYNTNTKSYFKSFCYYSSIFMVIIKYAPWQFFMTRLDNIYYIDWDILKQSKLRLKLDEFFQTINKDFVKLLSEENIKVPIKYCKN